ncbi:MAG: uncharacterized protein JWN94_3839 [Betaproteobacteria bacterium]|nr:uncharacterized protein [Betaproteobacteria bacterium]
MMRFSMLVFGLVSIAASAAEPTDAAPAAALTAGQIIEKNVAARGGLQAWRAATTLTLSGQLDAGGKKNVELPFVMQMKRPHKSRLEINFQDQKAVQVYDGAQGWKVRPFLGRDEVVPFTPAEAKAAASWAELDGPLIDYEKKGTKVEAAGIEQIEGRPTYKLKLTLSNGEVRNVWIDAKNFLEAKIDGEPRKMDGKMRKVAVYFRDYKRENGLTVPRVLETVVEGMKPSHKMTIERVAISTPLDDALFVRPQLALVKTSTQ